HTGFPGRSSGRPGGVVPRQKVHFSAPPPCRGSGPAPAGRLAAAAPGRLKRPPRPAPAPLKHHNAPVAGSTPLLPAAAWPGVFPVLPEDWPGAPLRPPAAPGPGPFAHAFAAFLAPAETSLPAGLVLLLSPFAAPGPALPGGRSKPRIWFPAATSLAPKRFSPP